MKKFVVYLMVIVLAVSLGFAVFYLVKDDEVISISSASIYTDVNKDFTIDVNHENKKSYTKINISSSDDNIVKYNEAQNSFSAISGGVARINFRTNNVKFRNLWCDVIVGDGTEASPYYISSVEQLSAIGMGERLREGVYAGAAPYTDYSSDKCYKLVSDIDVKDINEGYWIPLRNFSGILDGNGYTISNINIDYDAYHEIFKDANDFDPNLHTTVNVGLFESIDKTGKVFNIKLANYRAAGRYATFGTLAGINYGTIERIEVKDAFVSVETTEAFGGLVGQNITTEKGADTTYERFVARIDRCSVNLTLGKVRTFENEEFVEKVIGNTGIIGGLVGINKGGTIVYSYTKGEVNFASDSLEEIIYGGLIGENSYSDNLTGIGGIYPTIYQGANIKDCYSNIITHFEIPLTNSNSRIAGAIGKNLDFSNSKYGTSTDQEIVQNYIIGVYYNADNLKAEQEGITKNYNGIGEFTYGSKTINFVEDETLPIVIGLTTEDMKNANKFISHYTSDIEFDEEGVSQGIKSIAVNWLFDTVWAMNDSENDGMPYLNYQLVYIPNDFNTVGTPVVISNKYQYINTEVEYPITIVSGKNNKIYIEVGEEYNLKVSPAGLSLNWESNNAGVVSVDNNGTIKGLQEGSASISVTTKTGMFSDYIDVYVSSVSYSISNVPSEIALTVGEQYTLNGIVVTPSITLSYSSKNPLIASVDGTTGKITANAEGTTYIVVSAGNTEKTVKVSVVEPTSTIKAVTITLAKRAFEHKFSGTPISGQISISSAYCGGVDIKNQLTFRYSSTNTNILTVDNYGNYTVIGSGDVTVVVIVDDGNYIGYAYASFKIEAEEIKDDEGDYVAGPAGILKSSYNINVGDEVAVITFGPISSIIWTSTDTSIVTVNNGVIKGIAQGTATVCATILKDDGRFEFDSCDVTVINPTPTPVITLSPLQSSVYTGGTVKLTASLNITGNLQWTIKDAGGNILANPNALCSWNVVSNTEYEITMLSAGSIAVEVSYDNGNVKKTAVITAIQTTTYVKEIRTVDQLKNINNFLDKEFVLVADLDLGGVTWTPIGTATKPFTGIFTAKAKNSSEHFKITGLNVDSAYAGLFGYTKGATLNSVCVADSTIKGSICAGAIVGFANNTRLYNCISENNTITSYITGGIVGKMISASGVYTATVDETTVTTVSTNTANIGGVVGYMASGCIVNNATVSNLNSYISISSGSHGNAGGIAGHSQGTISKCNVTAKIVANKEDSDYAGGIVGYNSGHITSCIVSNTSIEGYHAGGIGGALNTGTSLSLKFKVTNNGYRKEDLDTYDKYTANVERVAVKDTVSILGEEVGGLFGIINSGVVMNCYTRAYLNGYTRTSYVSGFASLIMSSGFDKNGGKGQVGIVEYCYSACTFSGSCYDYAISKSQIHDDYNKRTAGYVFNFVFDSTLAKNTDYIDASGLFKKDPVQARKTTDEMKKKDTYTGKGFSSTYWNFSGGYPTLVIEG